MDKVKDIIANSGNNFHCKVFDYLKENGWTVLISPYYNDNITDKPREIDLIAEKAFAFQTMWGDFAGNVNIKLFIECKYIPQKIVFWFHDKDRAKAKELVVDNTPLPENNIYTEKHHYLADSDYVAKLFADERKQRAENELIYKSLNQSLNAMVYYRDSDSIIPESSRYTKATVNYPVIICNNFDNFYRVNIGSTDDPVNITPNFQLEVNYAYVDSSRNHNNEYFLIDIVSFDKLDDFFLALKKDTEVMGMMLRQD